MKDTSFTFREKLIDKVSQMSDQEAENLLKKIRDVRLKNYFNSSSSDLASSSDISLISS
ncbi:hypothetical protein PsAD26_04977 [Pseudovibrio sp. Ad26]|nr:hypothetical protein PsAD26_04977 [Pseudovibrio sp. Ad26]